jgi:hypothetical protein
MLGITGCAWEQGGVDGYTPQRRRPFLVYLPWAQASQLVCEPFCFHFINAWQWCLISGASLTRIVSVFVVPLFWLPLWKLFTRNLLLWPPSKLVNLCALPSTVYGVSSSWSQLMHKIRLPV